MDDDAFLKDFASCAIPHDRWRHRDHIKTAYLYLVRHPFDEALDRMRAGIQALNRAHKTPETLERGYHETITLAWFLLVAAALREHGAAENADTFCDRHPDLTDKNALRRFYSRDRIMSLEAKAAFVEPDLTPLPQLRNAAPDSRPAP
jgi:hypothetical protein